MATNFKGLCLFFYLFVTEPIFCEAVYRIRLAILPVKTFDSAGVSFPYPVPDHRKPLCKKTYMIIFNPHLNDWLEYISNAIVKMVISQKSD